MAILFATGTCSESRSIGRTTIAVKINTTEPARRRRALTLISAACASLDTEGLGLPTTGLRGDELSFLENKPIYKDFPAVRLIDSER